MTSSLSKSASEMPASEAIMKRLTENALKSERGQRTIGTLHRLKVACDDIASGVAAGYAKRANVEDAPFRIKPPRINSQTVGDYIKIRRQLEPGGEKIWPGPNSSTLRKYEDLKLYLDARQIEARGSQVRRKPRSSRAQTINGIAAAIPDDAARYAMMNEVQGGREARRQIQLLQATIKQLWGIDIDAIIEGNVTVESIRRASDVTSEDRTAVRALVMKLTNNRELLEFGLVFENNRVKAMSGSGASLISKRDFDLLRRLALIEP